MKWAPLGRATQRLLDLPDLPHLLQAKQAEGPAGCVDAPGAADAMRVRGGVGGHVDVDRRLERGDTSDLLAGPELALCQLSRSHSQNAHSEKSDTAPDRNFL